MQQRRHHHHLSIATSRFHTHTHARAYAQQLHLVRCFDARQLCSVGSVHVYPGCYADPHVALCVAPHAVWHAVFFGDGAKHAAVCQSFAVHNFKDAEVSAWAFHRPFPRASTWIPLVRRSRVSNVKQRFVWREAQPVGPLEIGGDRVLGSRRSVESKDVVSYLFVWVAVSFFKIELVFLFFFKEGERRRGCTCGGRGAGGCSLCSVILGAEGERARARERERERASERAQKLYRHTYPMWL